MQKWKLRLITEYQKTVPEDSDKMKHKRKSATIEKIVMTTFSSQ